MTTTMNNYRAVRATNNRRAAQKARARRQALRNVMGWITILTFVFVTVTVLSGISKKISEVRVNDEWVAAPATVSWYELNLREAAGTENDIVDVLEIGDEVYLTGNTQEKGFGSERSEIWVELATDSNLTEVIGWVDLKGIDIER